MNRHLSAILMMLCCAAAAQAQTPPPAVNTDPGRAQIVLPEPANPGLPSLILIGDSTVRNGRDDGQGKGPVGQWGWGNPLAALFDPAKINVVNRAIGGLSSRTYLTGGHWQRTLAYIKSGDVVLIQFGHNDGGAINDNSRARATIKGVGTEIQEIDNMLTGQHETVHSYGWYLLGYVADIKARGATAIICSPIPRKSWDANGKIARNRADYAGWAEQVAREQHIGFIDLNEQVARQYDAMGHDAVMQLFPLTTPDEHTHTNMAGAELNARTVVASLKALHVPLVLSALSAAGKAIPAAEDDRPVVDAAISPGEKPRDALLPTLFLVGDSTVKSGGVNGAIGWGERLAPYFDAAKINMVNHAIGGRSSRTFFTEGRWDKVLAQVKPGDFVAIQFGHNDVGRIGDPGAKNRGSVPGTGTETVEDTRPDGSKEQVHSFGWYMARYVADARSKGATVILLSPIPHRDRWEKNVAQGGELGGAKSEGKGEGQGEGQGGGQDRDQGRDFASYAQWDEEVARKGGALYADLTMVVTDGYRKIGATTVNSYFSDARTHTNDAGARFNAERVVETLKALPGSPLSAYFSPCSAWGQQGSLLQAEDFSGPLDRWVAEYAHAAGSNIATASGKLVMDVAGDATLWFKPVLSGDMLISYHRKVLMAGGANDRLSDMNQFWMAGDPHSDNLFTRNGTFSQYDALQLYYAGVGGNSNTTTRLRKYDGKGARNLLSELTDAPHLLLPNHDYAIEIAVYKGCTCMRVDGVSYFSYRDTDPLRTGRFGLRTTHSRQEISDFKVYQLQ